MVALDSSLQPVLHAKVWFAGEASEETMQLQESAQALGIDRAFFNPGLAAPKILWLKDYEPEKCDQTRWCVLPHDFVVLELGYLSTRITDAGDASGNGYAAGRKHTAARAVDLVDPSLKDRLPEVLAPDDMCYCRISGYTLSPNFETVEIPISVRSGDNMGYALGAG
jgi:sugar (pentulose or hexulose) kinase